MDKKIVFFDIDGTIYDYRTGIEPSTREAIRMLGENGHVPVICTGRAKAMIREEWMDLGFQGIVGSCGTYVEYLGVPVENLEIAPEDVKLISEAAIRHGINAILEGPEALYYNSIHKNKEYSERIRQMVGKYVSLKPFDTDPDVRMNKMTVHFNDISELEGFMKDTQGLLENILHYENDGENYAECVPIGHNKATGIEILLKHLGIQRENSYAFGDSVNDVEMLQYVEYGIAMGNSSPEVLEIAKYRTADMYEDGIYKGLKEFKLI